MFEDDTHVVIAPGDFDSKRADAANLIVLPNDVPGKSCINCEYFSANGCDHPKVKMMVQPHWACKFWENPNLEKASEFMARSGGYYRMRSVKVISRMKQIYNEMKISRMSDCGHDEDGDFSAGNDCASGGRSNKKETKYVAWRYEEGTRNTNVDPIPLGYFYASGSKDAEKKIKEKYPDAKFKSFSNVHPKVRKDYDKRVFDEDIDEKKNFEDEDDYGIK